MRLRCDRVIVMRTGWIVEQVLRELKDDDTKELLTAIPHPPLADTLKVH